MATKPPGITDPFSEAEENPLPVKQGLMERLNSGSGIPMVDEALKRDFMQKQAQANLYHKNAADINGLLFHLADPEARKSYLNPQTGQPYSDDDIQQLQSQLEHATGQYEKLVGVDKESKGALQKARTIIDFIHGKRRAAMQPPPTPDYPTTVGEGGVTTSGVATPRQGPVASPSSFATNVGDSGVSYDASKAQQLTPPPLSPLQEATRASTQLPFATHKGKVEQLGQDTNTLLNMGVQGRRALVQQMNMDETKPYIQDFILTGRITGNMAAMLRPPPRPAGSYTTSVLDARSRAGKTGEVFLNSAGDPIDIDSLDNSMGLKGMQVLNQDTGRWEIRYEPFSPNQATVTAGNQVIAVNPADKSKIGTEGAGTVLGPHNVPTTSTHTAPGITLSGTIGPVTTSTTKTPTTPGVVGRPGGGPIPPTIGVAPKPAGGGTAGPVPQARRGKSSAGNEQAIPFAAANQLNLRTIPVREAATQLFGDPTQPDLKSLRDYAEIAGDPKAQKSLANALQLTFSGLEAQEKAKGGLRELIGNYMGEPQALVGSQTKVLQDVIGSLPPREQEAYNATMASFGTIIGMRSLTKASAAQFSIKALEREVPLFGINTFSKPQFYDKMAHLAEQVYNGSRTLPIPQSEKDYYANKVTEFRQMAGGRKGGPSAAPVANQNVDDKIMELIKKP
jgi:hypothetical protein